MTTSLLLGYNMPTRSKNRDMNFKVLDEHLEMQITFPDGDSRDYTHRCTIDSFKEIAHTIDETASGATLEELVEQTNLPFSQVSTALSFLKERGCVVTRGRRSYAASEAVFEDAMIEYCYLEHHN